MVTNGLFVINLHGNKLAVNAEYVYPDLKSYRTLDCRISSTAGGDENFHFNSNLISDAAGRVTVDRIYCRVGWRNNHLPDIQRHIKIGFFTETVDCSCECIVFANENN